MVVLPSNLAIFVRGRLSNVSVAKYGEVCISELPLSTCIPRYPSPLLLRVNGMGAKGPWRLDEVVVEVAEAEKTYPEGTKPMQRMEFPGNSEK